MGYSSSVGMTQLNAKSFLFPVSSLYSATECGLEGWVYMTAWPWRKGQAHSVPGFLLILAA